MPRKQRINYKRKGTERTEHKTNPAETRQNDKRNTIAVTKRKINNKTRQPQKRKGSDQHNITDNRDFNKNRHTHKRTERTQTNINKQHKKQEQVIIIRKETNMNRTTNGTQHHRKRKRNETKKNRHEHNIHEQKREKNRTGQKLK